MKHATLILLFIISFIVISCQQQQEQPPQEDTPTECREPVVISDDFPIAIKYAEVDSAAACPTPVIGDVQLALQRKIAALCGQGECETGTCSPESTTVAINRQLNQFSIIRGAIKECWVVIEAEANTKCVCKED